MNHLTKVRIAYECSIFGVILSIFLKSLYPSVMQTAGMVALIASLAGFTGMFLGVKLAVYVVEYAIYKSRR